MLKNDRKEESSELCWEVALRSMFFFLSTRRRRIVWYFEYYVHGWVWESQPREQNNNSEAPNAYYTHINQNLMK